MRHWVCAYCGMELMYESADRLHTQSTFHLIDEHLDRVIETFLRYNEELECQAESCDGDLGELKGAEEQSELICEDCGKDHSFWWARMQAYKL